MKKGDCIHMATPGNSIPHLWIIVSDIDPKTDKCVIVNLTTLGHLCDRTVILHFGEHPSITHDSIVRYQDAQIVTANAVDAAIRGKAAFLRSPCSQEMLEKVVKGIQDSPETPIGIQKFCGFPTSVTVKISRKT